MKLVMGIPGQLPNLTIPKLGPGVHDWNHEAHPAYNKLSLHQSSKILVHKPSQEPF